MKESVLTIFILTLVILVAGSFTLAQKTGKHGPAVPKWAPIPGVSGVEYAPNLAQDLFHYRGGFYNFQGGAWFRGTAATGPWSPVRELPQVFYHIQAPYFKVPPGWAKGKKTGWGGASMPPGQTKKFDQGHIPPGKMKQKGGPKK